ncbi:hypothetical protein COLO4_35866 [Corchorus olitorius]|uniref:Uncharacterized protein n=1 Tax=Corchorus olitorius TaxID=93759 RepID=A0A1R3GCK3_9ROSI|nr:hypothetical protein COLO4_35866 [Corchorus olitorius]
MAITVCTEQLLKLNQGTRGPDMWLTVNKPRPW